MKNKSKHNKKIAISIISMMYMLTFSLVNSMFIHEVNPVIGYTSNISNESKETNNQEITKYTIKRNSLSGNEVSYRVDYDEDGVWYWEQQKSDYVPKKWTKYASDQWYYGPEISLGSTGDDQWHSGQSLYAPTFSIKYTGDRPSHQIYHPAIEDDPDTIFIDESEDEWYETVYDSWPNPYYAFNSSISKWNMEGSWQQDYNATYTYRWNSYNSKMSSFPKLDNDWEYVDTYSGDWNQSTYDHWNWNGSDYWNRPDRASTGYGNKDIYVDWQIETNGVVIDSGKKDILTHDVITQTDTQFAASNPKADYGGLTESQKHSSKAPEIVVPEPNESDWFSVTGTSYINISDLPLGWEYKFTADLMYVDKNGQVHTFDSYEDEFMTEKVYECKMDVWTESNAEDVITFGYDLYDPKNLRVSDVYWEVVTSAGVAYSGESQSNHFEESFYLPSEPEAEFNVYYDYSLSNDINGTPSPASSSTSTIRGMPGIYYENAVTDFEVWFDNIQDDSLIFNYYLETNNNFISEDSKIDVNINGKTYNISNIKPGTTSYFIDLGAYPELDDIPTTDVNADLTYEGGHLSANTTLNTETNLIKDLSIQLLTTEYINNTEAAINYVINTTGSYEDIINIQYNLNGSWYDLDYQDTNSEQTLELNNLKEQYVYNVQFKATTNIRDYYSNNFKFKTDRSSSIYLEEDCSTVGEHSASFTFNVDKVTYLDERNFTWDIIDLDDDKVLYEINDTIDTNGQKTVYADKLEANHDYRFVMNASVEGKTIMLYKDIKTNLQTNDKINNSYLYNVEKKGDEYTMNYDGKISSIQYSTNDDEWKNTSFKIEGNKVIISGIDITNYDHISFAANNQMRSQTTYYQGVKSTLIKPKKEIDYDKIVFWSLITFIILTIIISSIWAYLHIKKNKEVKIEGNIWIS